MNFALRKFYKPITLPLFMKWSINPLEMWRKRKAAMALEEFIQKNWLEDVSPNQSKQNIADGLVEILYRGNHFSNGLLVTDDGYFITAMHCLDSNVSDMSIRLGDGNIYSVHELCGEDSEEDVALSRVKMPNKCAPRKYRFNNTHQIKKSTPVAIMTRKSGHLGVKYGMINLSWNNKITDMKNGNTKRFANHFTLTTLDLKPGDSGGIIVNPKGELIGIVSAGAEDQYTSHGVKLIPALDLINTYKNNIW